ncbi:hypothetical protein RND71_009301 [Anisodus tanguticus]|uniref:J domain-containing protein n=1 Tax=Anisodus tanguticus TaxID=243964 RepID=A0AAE1SHK0_9SOLA|nr:hypothetical protein RND71_009301 [Anisodus tanguticus]
MLSSGEEGSKLSQNDISKAYRKKALELHPDKRPHDPNAHLNFQKLKTSYNILKDEKHRKLFDDLLRVQRQSQQDSKHKTMMSEIARKLKEEIARTRAKKQASAKEILTSVDKKKVLKVSWKKTGEDYTSQRLRVI